MLSSVAAAEVSWSWKVLPSLICKVCPFTFSLFVCLRLGTLHRKSAPPWRDFCVLFLRLNFIGSMEQRPHFPRVGCAAHRLLTAQSLSRSSLQLQTAPPCPKEHPSLRLPTLMVVVGAKARPHHPKSAQHIRIIPPESSRGPPWTSLPPHRFLSPVLLPSPP